MNERNRKSCFFPAVLKLFLLSVTSILFLTALSAAASGILMCFHDIPCERVRYRLLRKTDGFLISMPISDEIKAEYDFESVSIPDSDIALFAIYRRDPQKDGFIREYLELCKAPAL